jgi:hypothetical protein
MGFLAGDAPPGVQHFERSLISNYVRQRDAEAETLVEPEASEVGRESGFGGSHPEVGRAGQSEAATYGSPLDRRDHWEVAAKKPYRFLVKAGRTFCGQRVGIALVVKVGSGAEVLAFCAQHNGPALPARPQRFVSVGQASDEGHVEEIVRRPVDLDFGYAVRTDFDADVTELLAHSSS